MKRIALIHTVKPVLNSFEGLIREAMPNEELLIHNTFDDFLAFDPSPDGNGFFTKNNKQRLLNNVLSSQLTGCDLIVTTCSTLTPTIKEIRPFISTPIIAIDDAMAAKAVEIGSKIMVLATAFSTIEPTVAQLKDAALKIGKTLTIDSQDNEIACKAMKSGDLDIHNRMVKEQSMTIKGYDVIVLAQASMAHLEADIFELTKIPTVSSVNLCVNMIADFLKE